MDHGASKVLVTGGTGTIGPKVVSLLLSRGWQVTTVSRTPPLEKHPQLGWKHIDLVANPDLKGLTSGHDVVLHMANLSKVDLAQDRHVAEGLARDASETGVKHFFYTSSIRVYGNSAGLVWDGATPRPCEADTYAQNKVKVEELLRSVLAGTSTHLHILRVGDVITEQKFAAMPKALSFKGLLMWGRSRPHFIHVDDVARAIEFLLGARDRLKSEQYNITRELSGPSTYYDFFASELPPWKKTITRVFSFPPAVARLLYRKRSEAFGTRAGLIAEANLVNEGMTFSDDRLTQLFSSTRARDIQTTAE